MCVVQNHTSHYFAPDLPDPPDQADPVDPPETVAATAGPNLPSTRAGGQDDGSFTQTPSNDTKNHRILLPKASLFFLGGVFGCGSLILGASLIMD